MNILYISILETTYRRTSMAYSGNIKFIFETQNEALVEETPAGATSYERHVKVNADFSAKSRGDAINYNYNARSNFNDGHDITIV